MNLWAATVLTGVLAILTFCLVIASEVFVPETVRTFVTSLLIIIGSFLLIGTIILGSFAVREVGA